MNISKIENNQRTTTGRLPMAYLNHYITDLSELCRITGEDWRETALITPEFNAATHRLIETLEDGMLVVVAKSAEELAEELAQRRAGMQITMRQCRLILSRYSLLTTVEATVASIGGEAAIEWEYAGTVERNNPLVGMVANDAGMTEEQLDTMFTEAQGL